MKMIDAKGQKCPMPVILAKKEMERGSAHFAIEVDNETAVKNLEKLAASQGFSASAEEKSGIYRVTLQQTGAPVDKHKLIEEKLRKAVSNWSVFVGKDRIGEGSEELGQSLIKMYFYTMTQQENLPASILFMNSGVNLTCVNEQVVEHLQDLEKRGCEILVCGTCLNYFGLADQLKVGTVSNMYEIMQRMQDAGKVITL